MANDLQNRRNDLFGDWFNGGFFPSFNKAFDALSSSSDVMKTDVSESDKGYKVKIDLPGYDKKDIHLNYANDILAVTGHRSTFDDVSDDNGNILHSERAYGQVSCQYRLPDVDRDNISAKYDNGVLSLTLPKLDHTGKDDEGFIQID